MDISRARYAHQPTARRLALTLKASLHVTMTPYLWNGNFYCDGDIISVLVEVQPWKQWVDSGETPNVDDAETELDLIAEHFDINRNDPQDVEESSFPVRYTEPPEPPSCCAVCLNWFS